MADGSDNRSLGDLLAELSRETGVLVRKELDLATTELTAKARKAGAQIGIAAAGGALVHAGVLVLLAMLVMALIGLGLAAWLVALLVGVAAIAIGYLLMNRGLSALRSTSITPHQTIETLKEEARWTTRQGA
jgi:drug/metabolite transporter (DMT)-like permease